MNTKLEESIIKPTQKTLTYDRYLKIDELLSLQQPTAQPAQHDEYLFIIIHQVYELWFKQISLEVGECFSALKEQKFMALLQTLHRIRKIQDVLISQVSVLETMTPNDFNYFRDNLNPASGFQSYQFRVLEFRLGCKNKAYLNYFKTEPIAFQALTEALEKPSLYDVFLKTLYATGWDIPKNVIERDFSLPYEPQEEVAKTLSRIYRESSNHYELYLCAESMMDVDENFLLWRYRHVAMVERMIGFRRGTGGSSGAAYLQTTLVKRFFPELWTLRNYLGA